MHVKVYAKKIVKACRAEKLLLLIVRVMHAFRVRAILRTQLRSGNAVNKPTGGRRILVPLLETSHYLHFHILGLIKCLELRGAEVKVLICDRMLPACEIKNVLNDGFLACSSCTINQKVTLPEFGSKIEKLSNILSRDTIEKINAKNEEFLSIYPRSFMYEGIEISLMVEDSISRYFYGGVPDVGTAAHKKILRGNGFAAMVGIECAKKINSSFMPDVVMNHMQNYAQWKPYEKYFKSKGVPFVSVGLTTFNHQAITLSKWDLFYSDARFKAWLKSRSSSELATHEKKLVNDFFASRFSGNHPDFVHGAFFAKNQSADLRVGRLEATKTFVMFPNLFWEGGNNETQHLFSNVIEWVLETVEIFKQTDSRLIIKSHPGEFRNRSRKSVFDFVHERFPQLPSNVVLVSHEEKILPYQFFSRADVGLIYNGTLGLEMLIAGLPTIVAGKSPYGFLESATVPKTFDEYRKFILGLSQPTLPVQKEVELFAYFYFIRNSIPWPLTKQIFGQQFDGFEFNSLEDLLPGKNPLLDHLCNCILDPENTIPEAWPETHEYAN